MAERTTQPHAAVPLDRLRVPYLAEHSSHESIAQVIRDVSFARPASDRLGPPRCACPDPIAVKSMWVGPVLCQACGRRCG